MSNFPSSQGLSLYQLALDSLKPSQFFEVSLVTLKSLVGVLIDVLIERKIWATLWVKVPSTAGWFAELNRYQQHSGVAQKIYLCNSLGDDLIGGTNGIGKSGNSQEESQLFHLKLSLGSQLEREYFFLILSEEISSLIVASHNYQSEPLGAKKQHQSQRLSAIFTFDSRVIQRVFERIKDAIVVDDGISQEMLEFEESHFPQHSTSSENAILTHLLLKHIQQTEENLHSPTSSNLSRSNSVVSLSSAELTQLLDSAKTAPPPSADFLRDKDEFLKRVIQELRTPLTNMKTALKLLDAEQLKPVQRQRYMQLLNIECDRQNSLMTSLLELVQLESEPQPGVMPSVQLADIIPGVVSTYQPIAGEKGIQLGYTIPTGLPSVSCLETWLRQIIINLLNNSLKFTPTGGQVRVICGLQGDSIEMVFEDTGIGIPANEIPRVFDSFYRGRSTIGENTGAGLGLTIVQQLLQRCGGSISVTSQLGKGSNFKVLLPIASPNTRVSNA